MFEKIKQTRKELTIEERKAVLYEEELAEIRKSRQDILRKIAQVENSSKTSPALLGELRSLLKQADDDIQEIEKIKTKLENVPTRMSRVVASPNSNIDEPGMIASKVAEWDNTKNNAAEFLDRTDRIARVVAYKTGKKIKRTSRELSENIGNALKNELDGTKAFGKEVLKAATEIKDDIKSIATTGNEGIKGLREDSNIIKNSVIAGSKDFMANLDESTSTPQKPPTEEELEPVRLKETKVQNKGNTNLGAIRTPSDISMQGKPVGLEDIALIEESMARREKISDNIKSGIETLGEGFARGKNPERSIDTTTQEIKEGEQNVKTEEALDTDLVDMSKGPKTEEAQVESVGNADKKEPEEAKETPTAESPKDKTKNETAPKPKTKIPGKKPTNTLELGQRIRDIRRSKPRGFLLNKQEGGEAKENKENGDNANQESEIKSEIKNMPEKEKKNLENGLHNLGFRIEKKKNEYFVKTFDWIASKSTDQNGTVARFTRALAESYRKEVEMADKKAKAGKDASKLTKISNVAYLAKNVLRPYRIFLDATGMSPMGAQRYIMTVGMLSSRLTGAAKEARLANEKVSEQYRINDVKEAVDRAWEIYEKAKGEAGSEDKISRDNLEKEYIKGIPNELREKLKNPKAADNFFQSIVRKHLQWDMDRLNEDILEIEEADDVTEKEKKQEADQLLRRWEKRLIDYDRIIYNSGTISGWAAAARYAESTSKNIVRLATLQTLYLSAEKILHNLSGLVTHHTSEAHHQIIGNPGVKDAVARIHPSTGNNENNIASQLANKQELATPNENLVVTQPDSIKEFVVGEPIVTTAQGPEGIAKSLEHDALIEQARQKVEDNIEMPKMKAQIGITERYEHVDPTITIPGSETSGAKLDQLHDVIKQKIAESPTNINNSPSAVHAYTPPTNAPTGGRLIGENNVVRPYNQPRNILGITERGIPTIEDRQMALLYNYNLGKVFPENTRSVWDPIKSIPAKQILETSEQNADTQNLGSLISYLKRLEEVTGLEPKGRGLFNWKAESTEDFVKRAVEWARINGQLKDIEIQ